MREKQDILKLILHNLGTHVVKHHSWDRLIYEEGLKLAK